MAKGNAIIVTGERDLDRAMRRLPGRMQAKHVRKATRAIAKKAKARAVALTPKDEGAMAAAYQVRATTKSIKESTGKVRTATAKSGFQYKFNVKQLVGKEYGAKVQITRKSLSKQASKRDVGELRSRDYFYPAAVETGTKHKQAVAPLRRGLTATAPAARAEFSAELRKFVMSPT